ncbi:MAG: FAD:protein FMN transferase [Brotaphodocola sp.]
MQIKRRIKTAYSVMLLTASFLFTGCSRKEEAKLFRYQATFLGVFDTVTSVVGYAPDETTFTGYVQTLQKELEEYHQLYDIYHEYDGINNIRTINMHAGIEPVVVDQRIIDLLTESVELCEETNGSVNIAMGSVLSLWHDYRTEGIDDPEHASLPPKDALQKAGAHTNIDNLIIDSDASTVYLADPDMSLDVGAIAKGYATEMVCRSLQKQGFTHALVSVGGNTRAIGTKPDGSCWDVGIQNPDKEDENANLFVMELTDTSLVSSGTYQRYYTVNGSQYHHIIHPELLIPWDRYTQVTILCGNSGRADALSTAIFNMEPEEGKRFVENRIGIEAMWVFPDGSQTFSSGFQSYKKLDSSHTSP